jgi:hypothetical protein
MTEQPVVNKPARNKPAAPVGKPLRDLLGTVIGDVFTRQGFASAELVTRWREIAGDEIAAHSEPIKIQWSRRPTHHPTDSDREMPGESAPGTLVLRVEGPAAIEIQHLSNVVLERVNRFLGWRAVERIALRQAPLHRASRPARPAADHQAASRLAAAMPEIADQGLRDALGRLGAAVRRR